jgi:hypothetical protein
VRVQKMNYTKQGISSKMQPEYNKGGNQGKKSKHKASTNQTPTKHETKKCATKQQTKKNFFIIWGWGHA